MSSKNADDLKQFKWWWFTIQFDTEKKALAWRIPSTPLYNYACWRAHKSPKTGKYHVHCLVYYKSVQRFSTMSKKGFSKLEYLTTDERKTTVRNYCLRDNKPGKEKDTIADFIETGEPPKCCLEKLIKKSHQVYFDVIDPSVTYDQARESIIQCAPRDFLFYHDQIESGLKKIKKVKVEWSPRFLDAEWKSHPVIDDWIENQMPLGERAKCLIIVGPTRISKTERARHLFPYQHMYFRNNFNLDKWDPAAKLIIFDDIEWEFIPSKKLLLTQMGEGEITDKYMKKKTVHVTMPAIVILNDDPAFQKEHSYWTENTMIARVNELMFVPKKVKSVVHSPSESSIESESESKMIESESESKSIEISEDQKEEISEYRRTHHLSKKMSNLEILERIEADKLLDDRAEECIEYSKSFEYELPNENELKSRGIRIVK